MHWTPLENLFHTVPLGLAEWGIILAVASTVLWVEELRKLFHHRTPADDA